jgi:hypothetical protein
MCWANEYRAWLRDVGVVKAGQTVFADMSSDLTETYDARQVPGAERVRISSILVNQDGPVDRTDHLSFGSSRAIAHQSFSLTFMCQPQVAPQFTEVGSLSLTYGPSSEYVSTESAEEPEFTVIERYK